MCICHVMLCYVIKTTFLISMRAGELHCVAMASLSGVLSCRRSAQYRQDGGPDGMLMWTLWCKDIEDRASQRIVTRDDPPQEFNTSAIERRRRRTARNCQRPIGDLRRSLDRRVAWPSHVMSTARCELNVVCRRNKLCRQLSRVSLTPYMTA